MNNAKKYKSNEVFCVYFVCYFLFFFFFFSSMNLPKDKDSTHNKELDTFPSTDEGGQGLAAERSKYNVGKSGLAGFVKNPYVCFTAVFASIGGVLFGCKYI